MKLTSTHFIILGFAMLGSIFAYKGIVDTKKAMNEYIELRMNTPEAINEAVRGK